MGCGSSSNSIAESKRINQLASPNKKPEVESEEDRFFENLESADFTIKPEKAQEEIMDRRNDNDLQQTNFLKHLLES